MSDLSIDWPIGSRVAIQPPWDIHWRQPNRWPDCWRVIGHTSDGMVILSRLGKASPSPGRNRQIVRPRRLFMVERGRGAPAYSKPPAKAAAAKPSKDPRSSFPPCWLWHLNRAEWLSGFHLLASTAESSHLWSKETGEFITWRFRLRTTPPEDGAGPPDMPSWYLDPCQRWSVRRIARLGKGLWSNFNPKQKEELLPPDPIN